MIRQGGVYLEDMGQEYSINTLLAPECCQLVNVAWSDEINDNRQIAGCQAHAFLLTPLGEMIIPGDVNGDVQRRPRRPLRVGRRSDRPRTATATSTTPTSSGCIDRLAVFGFTVEDCNGNGIGDHCDIVDGPSHDCDENDVPDECQPDCSGDGVPDVCEPDCNGNGIPDPCDIAGGISEDCNGNGIPDECDEGGVDRGPARLRSARRPDRERDRSSDVLVVSTPASSTTSTSRSTSTTASAT